MRDKLIHGYFGVDYGLVWEAVSAKVPALREQLGDIVALSERQ
ncbi:MAG: HepT-like ribonuclease domain-containing protein [Candidatus Latescibacterota bacterium]